MNSGRLCAIALGLLLLQGCTSFKPTDLHYDSVQTRDMEFPVEYSVYTPPGWTKEESLPMILFLHGGGDNHTSFEKHGGNDYFDEQIIAGAMPRVILVSPNGRFGLWENWHDGSRLYRDWVLQEIVPEVQEQFNTLACPEHCHLMGISMGGFGALRFAYFAADSFSSVSAISAPIIEREGDEKPRIPFLIRLLLPIERIFGTDFKNNFARENPYNSWVNDSRLRDMRLQLIWGSEDRDGIRLSNRRLSAHLLKYDKSHDAFEYQGNHKWVAWKPNFNRVVKFLVSDPQVN